MEAMAEGCPVVSTDVAGIPELIGQSGEYGIMTKQRNAQSIADAIISLVNNHNVYSSFSLKGRERIENEFNVVKSADQLLELYSHPSKDKP
jgi:glycosyltransferase involved in cell wall biosynthesis